MGAMSTISVAIEVRIPKLTSFFPPIQSLNAKKRTAVAGFVTEVVKNNLSLFISLLFNSPLDGVPAVGESN